jgi:ribonuclease PH
MVKNLLCSKLLKNMLIRQAARREYDLRQVSFVPYVSFRADGSCISKIGNTHVFCTAMLKKGAPGISVECGILPAAVHPRRDRDLASTYEILEIQDVVKQSLSQVLDWDYFADVAIKIDCDVLQSEGGIKSACVSGAYVALALALKKLTPFMFPRYPLLGQVAGISCGLIKGELILDLDQDEHFQANVVTDFSFNDDQQIVHFSVKTHNNPVLMSQVNKMADVALQGAKLIFEAQRSVLSFK